MRIISLLFIVCISTFSCRVSKKIPDGEFIYGGSEVNLAYSDSLSEGRIPDFKTTIEEATRPLPNTMLFGWPYKVGFNYFLGKKKSEKGLKEWFREKLGEEPVFIDPNIISQNIISLNSLMHSYGYFNAKVSGKIKEKSQLAYAHYQIEPKARFAIDSLIIQMPGSDEFDQDFFSFSQHFRLPKYFDLESLKSERQRMFNDMKNIGYYNFKPDNINILLDSSQVRTKLIAKISPAKDIPSIGKKRYQINNVYVNIDNSSQIENIDENSSSFNLFRGLVLEDPKHKFKERIFLDAIALRPGTLYNNDAVSITNNRLLKLGNFKSVQSYFNVVNQLDSTLLDVYYNLQTGKRNRISAEANALSRSSGLAGTQLGLNWQNYNLFRGGEQIKIGINTNFEFQVGGRKEGSEYNENYRTGTELTLSFPRFLAPFIKIDPEVSKVLPKTLFKFEYTNFIKKGLYNLNSSNAEWSYAWTRGKGFEHRLTPFTLTLAKSSNLSLAFIEEIFSNPLLISVLDNQFIVGMGYEFSYFPIKQKRKTFSYTGIFNAAGTFLGLYDNIFRSKDDAKYGKFFKEIYSQFVRFENDVRYRQQLTKDLSWANRAIIGVGIPYGNSQQLPFVNQFFVGGSNSLRAFRAREVGPGSYRNESADGNESEKTFAKFLGTNTGDIKIEFNTELRYKLSNLLGLALFADAGNVWMYKDPYIYDDRVLFSGDFLKDMAIGGGLGFRFDFSFLIFRLDVATPFRIPYKEESERWVFDDIKLGSRDWRKENIIWNFGIGLPF